MLYFCFAAWHFCWRPLLRVKTRFEDLISAASARRIDATVKPKIIFVSFLLPLSRCQSLCRCQAVAVYRICLLHCHFLGIQLSQSMGLTLWEQSIRFYLGQKNRRLLSTAFKLLLTSTAFNRGCCCTQPHLPTLGRDSFAILRSSLPKARVFLFR